METLLKQADAWLRALKQSEHDKQLAGPGGL
jgi:hypothetical protein